MTSDMVVALARATSDGHALFGHNFNVSPRSNRSLALLRAPGHDFAAGEAVQATNLSLPQARQTHAVLAGRCSPGWGYDHGVNVHGVAVGWTAIRTRLQADAPALTGPDLVRLTLERAGCASQAIEILTDLIGRHGQGSPDTSGQDAAWLIADAREAFLLEAAGRHWVVGHVGSVKALTGVCLLRQDWDRISRGLADLAIACGWTPEDGCKLDFAATLGLPRPDHVGAYRRWGQLTLALEQHSGQIDDGFLRRLLREQAQMLPKGSQAESAGSMVVRLGSKPGDLPLAWVAFGPSAIVYLPVLPLGDLPPSLANAPAGCRLAGAVNRWLKRTPEKQAREEAAEMQRGLDVRVAEFLPEAHALHRRGPAAAEELSRLAGSFMQHCSERVEQWVADREETASRDKAMAEEVAERF